MSAYTSQQIADAHLTGIKAGNQSGHEVGGIAWVAAYRDAYTEALGLTVEDPKPEPGWYTSRSGSLAFVDREAKAHFFGADRTWSETPNGDWGKYFTPARVVPAEPVELTEEDALRLFASYAIDGWEETPLSSGLLRGITATVNAALRKHN